MIYEGFHSISKSLPWGDRGAGGTPADRFNECAMEKDEGSGAFVTRWKEKKNKRDDHKNHPDLAGPVGLGN